MSTPDYPLIPYGWADFRAMRLENRLYVDKTHFLRPLENERFVFLIRPRRFGKSCWLSLLENYYDRSWAGEFEQVFGGTDIGREPTENRHSFVVLRFDFSVVHDAPETLEREFENYCGKVIRRSMERHPDLFPQDEVQRILATPSAPSKRAEETVYNTNMVLYFLAAAMPNKPLPDDLIDENVRTDYSQLRHLLADSQNGATSAMQRGASNADKNAGAAWRPKSNLELLRRVVDEGQMEVEIQTVFTLERLHRGENFLSLLYYFGLLSVREDDTGRTCLYIPNQTAHRVLHDLLCDADNDGGARQPDRAQVHQTVQGAPS